MRKTWLIIKHEYLTNVKRRSFLFAAFGVPLFTIVMMMLVYSLAVTNETDVTHVGAVGYVDQSGVLQKQVDMPDTFHIYDTEEAARAALNGGTIGAYFVVAQNYMQSGQINAYSKSGIPAALGAQIDQYLLSNLSTGLDATVVERIQDPVETSIKTLDNGRIIQISAIAGLFLAPILFVIIFMIASQTTCGYLMSSVVEEKTNRLMELLVTSVTPLQLLVGKIVGLGALGLTTLVVWAVTGLVTLSASHNLGALAGVTFPPDLLVVGLVYFLLGYFLLASVMAGIGAVAGSEQESRQLSAVFSFLYVIPIFFITSFVLDPNGTAATVLTLFPLTAPVAVLLRMGISAVPTWQLLLSIGLLLVTALGTAWASARIFRWGLLLYGKRPSVRELVRVVRHSPTMATTASGEGKR